MEQTDRFKKIVYVSIMIVVKNKCKALAKVKTENKNDHSFVVIVCTSFFQKIGSSYFDRKKKKEKEKRKRAYLGQ